MKKMMGRCVIFLLVTFLLLPQIHINVSAEEDSTVIYIRTATELLAIGGEESAGQHFVLANDIVLSGNWNPIVDFRGTLDGDGHTITMRPRTISGNHFTSIGLFRDIYTGTVLIQNLNIEVRNTSDASGVIRSSASVGSNSAAFAGGLIGRVLGDAIVWIENVSFDGIVEASSMFCTLIGNDLSLQTVISLILKQIPGFGTAFTYDDLVVGNIQTLMDGNNARAYAGGLIGYMGGNALVTISNSIAEGRVVASSSKNSLMLLNNLTGRTYAYAGGLVGYRERSTFLTVFRNSGVANTLSASQEGLLGSAQRGVIIARNGYSTGINSRAVVPPLSELRTPISSNYPIVSAGWNHTAVIKADGSLWSFGCNRFGQIGNGTASATSPQRTPVRIGTSYNWVDVTAGGNQNFALQADGSLWAWGDNFNGSLGDGTAIQRNTPVRIGTATDWVRVSSDGSDNYAIRTNGTLWVWGFALTGNAPTQVGNRRDWVYVAPTAAIRDDGSLWTWGTGAHWIGSPNTTHSLPVRVGTSYDWQNVISGRASFAIKSDGSLWAWGWNRVGQLGDGTTIDRHTPVQIGTSNNWESVSVGPGGMGDSIFAIKSDGTLWAWGYNHNGRLGDGTTINRHAPVQIGTDNNWVSVDTSGEHTVAVKNCGSVWAWGSNFQGQLGISTNNNPHVNQPVMIMAGEYSELMTTSSPLQPTGTRSGNTITINRITAPVGWTTQYRIRTGETSAWGEWQHMPTFTVPGAIYPHQVQTRFLSNNTATHLTSMESAISANIPGIIQHTNPPAQPTAFRSRDIVTVDQIFAPSGWTTQYRIRAGETGTWSAWQTSRSFTVPATVTTHQVQAKFLANHLSTHETSIESPVSANITAYIQQTNAPTQPVGSRSGNVVTVTQIIAPTGWTTEYRIRTGTGSWGNWQTGRTFTVATNATTHQIQARFRANNTTTHAHSGESPISANITVAIQTTNPPPQPVGTRSGNTITMTQINAPDGWTTEYRIRTGTANWGNWQTGRTFTVATNATTHQVQARFRANNTTTHAHSGESVASANIVVAIQQTNPPVQPTGNRTGNSITVNPITAPNGWTTQYRIRAGTGAWGAWQTGNTFAVPAGTSPHQVQARFLATNASTHATTTESSTSVEIREVGIVGISVSPTSPDFGSHSMGYAQRPAQTITVTNTGTQNVTMNALPSVTGWTMTPAANWRTEMQPNQSRTFTIRPMTGLAEGTRNPTINITGSGGVSVQIWPTFTVTDFVFTRIDATPASHHFGNHSIGYNQRPTQTITISNMGAQNVTLNPLPTVPDWTLEAASNWTTVMQPNQTRTFTIRPNNNLPAGLHNPTVYITGSGGANARVWPTFTVTSPDFIPAIIITDVPETATVGTPLTLTGTVNPPNATNRDIIWSVVHDGGTGANITGGNILNATSNGRVMIGTTIINGLGNSRDFTWNFTIDISLPAGQQTIRNVGFATWNVDGQEFLVRADQLMASSHTSASFGTLINIETRMPHWTPSYPRFTTGEWVFEGWELMIDRAPFRTHSATHIQNANSLNASFILPAYDVVIIANFRWVN